MVGYRFRALRGAHGVSRRPTSRRTSKIGGLAPEPIPPSDQLPPLVFEANFLENGSWEPAEFFCEPNMDVYR